MKKRTVIFLTVPIISFVIASSSVKATSKNETVNDLFNIYNQKQVENADMIQDEYSQAKRDYEYKKNEIAEAETFNKLYDAAKKYQTEKKEVIDTEVNKILTDNKDIYNSISLGIEGDWNTLLDLDAQYKVNLDSVNTLLESKNKYLLTEKQDIDYSELKNLKKAVKKVTKSHTKLPSTSSNNFILGEVNGVKFPIRKSTKVKTVYGNVLDPMTKASVKFHPGIDLLASNGTNVLSLFNGEVVSTGYSPTNGYFVSISHGQGVRTYYAGLSEIKCKMGDKVMQYDVIGLSGNTGIQSITPHLHLGIYFSGISVDPSILFQ